MDSPLAPPPITPGIRTHRVTRAGGDRKGKGGAFRDQLAHERQDPQAPRPPSRDGSADKRPEHPEGEPGHLLDIEA